MIHLKSLTLLLSIFFSFKTLSSSYQSFTPNFNGQAMPVASGTTIKPLCTDPQNPLCIQQWSSQAIPLAVYLNAESQIPQYEYFLPVFIPKRTLKKSSDNNWRSWSPPLVSRRRTRRSSVYYKNKSNPSLVRVVRTDENGDQTVSQLGSSSTKHKKKEATQLTNPIGDPDWELDLSRSKVGSTQAFSINTNDPQNVRVTVTNTRTGEQVIEEGTVSLAPVDDISSFSQNSTTQQRETNPSPTVSGSQTQSAGEATALDSDIQKNEGPLATGSALTQATLPTQPALPTAPTVLDSRFRGNEGSLPTLPTAPATPAQPTAPQQVSAPMAQQNIPKKMTAPEIVSPPKDRGRDLAVVNWTISKDSHFVPTEAPTSADSELKPESNEGSPDSSTSNTADSEKGSSDSSTSNTADSKFKPHSQTGCLTIDNPTKTVAGYCFECLKDRSAEQEPILSQLIDPKKDKQEHEKGKNSFWAGISDWLTEVTDFAKKKVDGAGVKDFTKICPADDLSTIINNFNNKCKPTTFNSFLKKACSESCKNNPPIPPEIMLALMSVESSGRCSALNDNDKESSAGLFQINAENHKCTNVTKKNYTSRIQCLKNPINNLMTAVHVLIEEHYKGVNPEGPKQSSKCQNWSKMPPEEKDKWRKAIAAYNSGAGWVTRAIKSVKDDINITTEGYFSNTFKTRRHNAYQSNLEGSHKTSSKYKKHDPSWEDMRVYFFTEKLLQNPSLRLEDLKDKWKKRGNKKHLFDQAGNRYLIGDEGLKTKKGTELMTGRALTLTLNNLAYTEAILGRNKDNSYPGLVEVWEQYIKNKNPTCKN